MSDARPPILARSDDPSHEDYLQLWDVLKAFNVKAMGDCEAKTLALLLRDPDSDAVMGGLWGRSLWGSFFVDMLVAPEDHRGAGWGRELLGQAEAEARAQGCTNMWLDTFAFQARPFYEKLGFRVFGELGGPHKAFPRYFMVKDLAPETIV